MVSERSLAVLRAIVQDYVASREPVGSKTIVERHAFGVSAATIRNDMALLEEEELIAAPHTSSGRVPTDKGYRVFVDQLTDLRPLTPGAAPGHRDVPRRVERPRRRARPHRAPHRPAHQPGRRRAVPDASAARACATSSSSSLAPDRVLCDPHHRLRPGRAAPRSSSSSPSTRRPSPTLRVAAQRRSRAVARMARCRRVAVRRGRRAPIARHAAVLHTARRDARRAGARQPPGPARRWPAPRTWCAPSRTSPASSSPCSRRSRSR